MSYGHAMLMTFYLCPYGHAIAIAALPTEPLPYGSANDFLLARSAILTDLSNLQETTSSESSVQNLQFRIFKNNTLHFQLQLSILG